MSMVNLKQFAVPGWHDRWNRPDQPTLVKALKDHHRKHFTRIQDTMLGYDRVACDLAWFGPSWRWSFRYRILNVPGREEDPVLAYQIPNPEAPILCLPMEDAAIASLPKKINRYVRDGIRSGKCSVALHWALWTPTNELETDHLADLVRRVHVFYTKEPKEHKG